MAKNKKGKKLIIKGFFKTEKFYYCVITDQYIYSVSKENLYFAKQFIEDNDEIEALFIPGKNPKMKVINVIKRHNKYTLGYIRKINSNYFLEPLKTKFLIKLDAKAHEGQFVKAQIKNSKNINIAHIVEIYSPESINDEKIVIDRYNLPMRFSVNTEKEIETISEPSIKDFKNRIDLRDLPTITIDGKEAKDFDDAVDIEFLTNGYRLYIHIADVSYYVRESGALEKDAMERGFSVYFPQNNIPMLPRKLSDNICSLLPNKDRLAFSVIIDFDKKGIQKSFKFVKSIIKNKNRLTYEFVENCLNSSLDCDKKLQDQLIKMKILAKILRSRRFLEGSLDLDMDEASFIVENNEIVNVVPRPKLFSYKIIEEFMLAANKAVADYLNNKVPFLRRIHEKPQADKLAKISLDLKELGYIFPTNPNAKKIDNFIRSFELEKRGIISKLILRSLERAEYSLKTIGHFALGFENYTHFTSPIRRFPDLLIHRILYRAITNKKPYNYSKLEEIAQNVQKRELITESAEYYAQDIKQARLISKYIGKTFNGMISSMISSGCFIELKEIFVEGFLPYSAFSDDYYEFFEQKQMIIGNKTHKIYRLGDFIKITPKKVDIFAGKIDLACV